MAAGVVLGARKVLVAHNRLGTDSEGAWRDEMLDGFGLRQEGGRVTRAGGRVARIALRTAVLGVGRWGVGRDFEVGYGKHARGRDGGRRKGGG